MSVPWPDALASEAAQRSPEGRPLHFGDPAAELDAALTVVAVADRSHLGRLLATGPDILDLLHRLSTADLAGLREGEGRPAVLLTPKGRIVQRIFVHHLGEAGVLIVAGPAGAARTREHLQRFTFAEQTGLRDASAEWIQWVLVGPRSAAVLDELGLPRPGPGGVRRGNLGGCQVYGLGEEGLSTEEGFSIVCPDPQAAVGVWRELRRAVEACGGRAIGDQAFEAWRILRGLPEHGHELTEEHNPLEAGLWDCVSFTKGCYVGQEVVARLRTYDKVASELRGFVFPQGAAAPAPGTPLYRGEHAVGEITSAIVAPGRTHPVALGYVKRKTLETGERLGVGSPDAALHTEPRPLPLEGPPRRS